MKTASEVLDKIFEDKTASGKLIMFRDDVLEAMDEYAKEMCKQQRVICANRVPTVQVTGELYNMIYNNIKNCENPIDGYFEV